MGEISLKLITLFSITTFISSYQEPSWLDSSNNYIPPTETDLRGSCPFLNTLANHGLVNRNGTNIDLFEMAQTVANTFDLSVDFNNVIAQLAVDNGQTFQDSKGIERIDLDSLCTHAPQPVLEHDSSLTRQDFFFEPNGNAHCRLDDSLLNDFMRFRPYQENVTVDDLLELLLNRILDSRTRNPEFQLTQNGTLEIAAQYETLLFLGADPELKSVSKTLIYDFMLFERIPESWVPGLLRDPNFEPFFPPGDPATDVSASIFPLFMAQVETAVTLEVKQCRIDNERCSLKRTDQCCEGYVCERTGKKRNKNRGRCIKSSH